ncbi:MAG: RNA polymerase sigma factor [Pseudomonadota bacterium]
MPATPEHYAQAPEALVVSLAVGGDRLAFTEIVQRYQPWVRNFMRRLCSDQNQADDLAQDVFLKAWRTIRQLKDPESFGGWLRTLATREWIDDRRKRGATWDLTYDDDFQETQQQIGMTAIDLDAALATLPEPVRLCIVLSYHDGLSHREIADVTQLADGTVKSHIRRGGKRLQKLLAAYGGAT